jgi:Fur family ferric uptake transcriptional regulator
VLAFCAEVEFRGSGRASEQKGLNFSLRQHNGKRVKKSSDIIQRTLVAEGFNQTEPRRLVLDVFLNEEEPLTPAAVHRRLPDRSINLASVYRAIELFCRLGVLAEVDHVAEGKRYELSDDYREHHHHLICQQCGKTEDFEDCEMEEIEKLIRRRFRFKVMRHDLRFIGVCSRCQK